MTAPPAIGEAASSGAAEPASVTGGCQCGAVRFRIEGELTRPSICHCRMCQRAIGAPFGAFAIVPPGGLVWTREAPAYFQSSNVARRAFCAKCGTSLTWESDISIDIALFALDDPAPFAPVIQLFAENSAAWLATLPDIPRIGFETEELAVHAARVVSHQHSGGESGGP
jgi:hypothetical protein